MKSVSAFLIVFLVVSFIFTFVSPAAQYDPEVYRVQKALKEAGYNPGTLDGLWGRATRSAIRGYQHDGGLMVTGELDAATRAKLGIESPARGFKTGGQIKDGAD